MTLPPPTLTPPPWQAVRDLFERALLLDPGAREALLASPGLDLAARDEVRSLLQHHDEAATGDEFLSVPAEGHTTVGGLRRFTPHCAGPEQARGEPVISATDNYSLGVLLYQLLTGARPR